MSRSTTHSITTTEGVTTSTCTSTMYTARENDVPEQRGLSESTGEANHITGESFAESVGYSKSRGRTRGRSQTLKPVREERATQFYSLDEGLHLAQLKLRNLPDRAAIVKRRGKRTIRIETAEVKSVLKLPLSVARFRALVCERSSYLVPLADAEAAIEARRLRLSQLADEPIPMPPPAPLKDEGWG